jgi:hypothetical protein
LSSLEWALLISYLAAVFAVVVLSPPSSERIDSLAWMVDWVPAAHRLIEISAFPSKTTAWLLASYAFSPLAFLFFAIRTSRIEKVHHTAPEELVRQLRGYALWLLISVPWLLFTWYRPGMSRGGAWISGLGELQWWLAGFGPVITLAYWALFSLTLLAVAKFLARK